MFNYKEWKSGRKVEQALPMSVKKPSDDASRTAVKAGGAAPMLISLDFSALMKTIEEQNNRIEMLELRLQKKDDEVAALAASVTVCARSGWRRRYVLIRKGLGCEVQWRKSDTRTGPGQHC